MGIVQASLAGGRKSERKKKADELLSSVVRETALPAAIELLRSNEKFTLPNGSAWAVLFLRAANIGGLSKKHSRDEAKGSIIELIESDQIETIATAEMLAEEIFGIIPTPETLERMDEYSLLTGAEYQWGVLWLEPGTGDLIIDLGSPATFAEAKYVSEGTFALREVIGEEAWSQNGGSAQGAAQDAEAADAGERWDDEDEVAHGAQGADADEFEEPAGFESEADFESTEEFEEDEDVLGDDEGDPLFDGGFEDEAVYQAEAEAEAEAEFAGTEDAASPVYDESFDEADLDEPSDSEVFEEHVDGAVAYDDVVAPAPAQAEQQVELAAQAQEQEPAPLVADEQQVRRVITRRFLGDDLGLEVSLAEFVDLFSIGTPIVRFDVPEGTSSWLAEQVATKARQANVELEHLRQAHDQDLKSLYVELMSRHVEMVTEDLSLTKAGARYAKMNAGVKERFESLRREEDEKISARRTQIADAFEADAKAYAAKAAAQAEAQFRERNRARMEREMAEASVEVKKASEDDYSVAQQQILELRRRDASLKFERGRTLVMATMREHQAKQLEAERDLVERWNNAIQTVIDDNRKHDVSQAEALAESLARRNEVADLQAEQERALARLQAEADERVARMEVELERARREAASLVDVRDSEWQHSLALEKEKTAAESARNRDLREQMDQREAELRARYESRIEEVERDKEGYAAELERASLIQSRSNKILMVLVVVLSLFMLVAGWIWGASTVSG